VNAPIRTVVLSGGLDSTTVLALALDDASKDPTLEGRDPRTLVQAVSFDYGQRHVRELESAVAIAAFYGVNHKIIDIKGLLHGSALLYAGPVPEGHYAEDTMKATVVNGRNLLFASAAIAATPEGGSVWLGVHAGDHFVYPDCRPEFWSPLAVAVKGAYDIDVTLPIISISKAEALSQGFALDAPVELSWSCYAGGEENGGIHCGRCGTCVERAEAFALAGIPDPTEYEDPDFWVTAIADFDTAHADA
jgi:7-cyano-7-deazaguanine synthase